MAIEVPRSVVELILLGPEDDRRQLQDSPILGDVWLEFAKTPDARLELLIAPYKEQAAGRVASILSDYTQTELANDFDGSNVAYLQGIVAAQLSFEQVLRFVVPMTRWWIEPHIGEALKDYNRRPGLMREDIGYILGEALVWFKTKRSVGMQDIAPYKRYIALAGLIVWAGTNSEENLLTPASFIEYVLKIQEELVERLWSILFRLEAPKEESLVWQISRNRQATAALTKSVPAVKADAARNLFTVDCSGIVWAVIDSGIHAAHDAFKGKDGKSRIKRSFDFTKIRDIISLDNALSGRAQVRLSKLLRPELKDPPTEEEVFNNLQSLAKDARRGRSVDWGLVQRLVEIDPNIRPQTNHGTHVAGILAANREGGNQAVGVQRHPDASRATEDDRANGMCPDIYLYDFRVLSPDLKETEFAIIAALQFIRYLNGRNSYMTIHGANLSLSIRHDVRNYACGHTPVCNECELLINSGVVVVTAAGNRGYQNFETKDGPYEGYAAFSITDPGNAEGAITVGATHRSWPHTYGVSFFSSRGPTGDGRIKPDLVAPGERIRAPLPDNLWGDLDGTSMAAPHVSGAAAMLMARYSELIGQPRRIKQILCDSATDLGRERTFQGNGMLDVLRALQSI